MEVFVPRLVEVILSDDEREVLERSSAGSPS
jgi:hypothetical protein